MAGTRTSGTSDTERKRAGTKPPRAKPAKQRSDGAPKGRKARAEAKRRERIAKMRAKSGARYRVHYDIDGPRVRLGIVWFVGAMVACALGVLGVVVYFGIAFAAASSHCLRTWRARGASVDPRVALGATAFVLAGAALSSQAMGIALLGATGAVVALSGAGGGASPTDLLARASLALQSVLPAAVAGGCIVRLADVEIWAVVSLVLLASAYETGDYLIGSGSTNAVEGPIAGGAAVLVMTMAIAAAGVPPFGLGQAFVFGVAVAPGAAIGQLVASAMLPHSRAFAPALRRVDSLLLVAPCWYLGIDLVVL